MKIIDTFTIPNSYQIRKRADMTAFIKKARTFLPENKALNNRTITSLVTEWCAHNLLYDLHLFRSHTATVDLEYPERWYFQFCWKVLAWFYKDK